MKVYDKQYVDGRATTLQDGHHYVYLFIGDVLTTILKLEDEDVSMTLDELRSESLRPTASPDPSALVDAVLEAADELYGLPDNYGAEHRRLHGGYLEVWVTRRECQEGKR